MSKRKLSLRTLGIIEQMWSRGISDVSIAGSTQVRLDRVQEVTAVLEFDKSAKRATLAERYPAEEVAAFDSVIER